MKNASELPPKPSDHASQPLSPTNNQPAVPHIDPQALLKIETEQASQEESGDEPLEENYGKKLFLVGVIYCMVIVVSVAAIALMWTQSTKKSQEVITIERMN